VERIAIYSLNIRSIGRTTHAAGTAGAYVRYITRPDAHAVTMAGRMPLDRWQAKHWIDQQEQADRKNARVIDKLVIALPREFHPLQRAKLVRILAERITQGRASWFAAIHQVGQDLNNPHVHLVIRDRDTVTGKRVALLSEKGACDWVRLLWETLCNEALERAGMAGRIDRRSHAVKGIQSAPARHRGPLKRQFPPPAPESAPCGPPSGAAIHQAPPATPRAISFPTAAGSRSAFPVAGHLPG
jgi:hypothetical protein